VDKAVKALEDRLAYLRLERDRVARLKADLDDAGLHRAIKYLDLAVVELGQVRNRLEGER
jgi:hypothetical protein